jgi:hypothetical protein
MYVKDYARDYASKILQIKKRAWDWDIYFIFYTKWIYWWI